MKQLLLFTLTFYGCCASKDAYIRKLLSSTAEVEYVLRRDTILIPRHISDTIIRLSFFRDTVRKFDTLRYSTDRVEVRVLKSDTVVKIEADCKEQEIVVEKEVVKVAPAKTPWLIYLLASICVALIAICIIILIKK